MAGRQSRQDIRMGMAEGVLESRRNQRDRGRDRVQKRLDARGSRTVMAHLENIRVDIGTRGQELSFDGAFHVAGEQERSRPVCDP